MFVNPEVSGLTRLWRDIKCSQNQHSSTPSAQQQLTMKYDSPGAFVESVDCLVRPSSDIEPLSDPSLTASWYEDVRRVSLLPLPPAAAVVAA